MKPMRFFGCTGATVLVAICLVGTDPSSEAAAQAYVPQVNAGRGEVFVPQMPTDARQRPPRPPQPARTSARQERAAPPPMRAARLVIPHETAAEVESERAPREVAVATRAIASSRLPSVAAGVALVLPSQRAEQLPSVGAGTVGR